MKKKYFHSRSTINRWLHDLCTEMEDIECAQRRRKHAKIPIETIRKWQDEITSMQVAIFEEKKR